jgi:hypothetical protein
MTEEELNTEFYALVCQLPHRRYRHACAMLARQAALREAGPNWAEYFEKHRHRLLEDAAELIASRRAFARYRIVPDTAERGAG